MSKWYEVSVKAFKTALIEVEDSQGREEAIEIALDDLFSFVDEKEVCDVTDLSGEPMSTAGFDEVYRLDE